MNDFTKEELIKLLDMLHDTNAQEWQLEDKIQSMINNYCDHDWENPCCGCPNSSPICDKCGKII